jgi:hypothetical protein
MEEACFTGNGNLTISDQHTRAAENPYSFEETQFYQQLAINIYAGIIGDLPLGPYELPPLLSGSYFCSFYLNIY